MNNFGFTGYANRVCFNLLIWTSTSKTVLFISVLNGRFLKLRGRVTFLMSHSWELWSWALGSSWAPLLRSPETLKFSLPFPLGPHFLFSRRGWGGEGTWGQPFGGSGLFFGGLREALSWRGRSARPPLPCTLWAALPGRALP